MGMFSAIRDTVIAVCNPVISAANAADESLSMATSAIHNRATAHKLHDRQHVIVETSEKMLKLDVKLDNDPKLKALYSKLEQEFD